MSNATNTLSQFASLAVEEIERVDRAIWFGLDGDVEATIKAGAKKLDAVARALRLGGIDAALDAIEARTCGKFMATSGLRDFRAAW